ncbi:hypothetical protein ID866_2988, partial [Astraeus odoratus]
MGEYRPVSNWIAFKFSWKTTTSRTWQDGVKVKDRWKCTNILVKIVQGAQSRRCAGGISDTSDRVLPNRDRELTQLLLAICRRLGATGLSLADKVQEAYAFIAQNYFPGDEIFLFGFSRGAYTARMVAMFIGAIGVLDKTDMDYFADIFLGYQKLGKSTDPKEIAKLKEQLDPWTSQTSRGKKRADLDRDSFTVKCVGVFDTVGSVGLPEEITHKTPPANSIFGFPNTELGDHIQ